MKESLYYFVAPWNVFLGVVTVFAAYGGYFDPANVPVAALAPMFLMLILVLDILTLVLDAIFWRKAMVPILLSWVVAAKPLLVFAPLNTSTIPLTEEQEKRTFTLLTYNVTHFQDIRGHDYATDRNAMIDFILKTDADMVNLQELGAEDIDPDGVGKKWGISRELLQELSEKYPFRFVDDAYKQTFMSKFPALHEELRLWADSLPNVAVYRVHVKGQIVRLYDVHLRSLFLTDDDKALFRRLTDGETGNLAHEVRQVKNRLIDKLTTAFDLRAGEAAYIRSSLDLVPGNAIVAGDFNDVPGCYAVRTIMGDDMHDAYAEAGFGPVITFHKDRFYFRIDQILYRGNLKALEMERIKVPYSDHYPMLAKFYIGK